MDKRTAQFRKVVVGINYAQSVQGALAGNRYACSLAARFRVGFLPRGESFVPFTTK